MHDLVIRNASLIDGTGAAPRITDVAVDGETIVSVDRGASHARREIDGEGLMLTPVSRDLIFLGKALGNLLFLAISIAIALPVFAVLFKLKFLPLYSSCMSWLRSRWGACGIVYFQL